MICISATKRIEGSPLLPGQVGQWGGILQGSPSCFRSGWGKSRHGAYKGGLNTKIHLPVDAHGMPVRILVTAGTVADCKQAIALIDGLTAEYLLADRGYDSDAIVKAALSAGMQSEIPPKKNRKQPQAYDKDLYKLRHLVENAFLHLKRWRGIATCYAKNTASFLAAVHIRCIAIWANVLA